MDHDPVSRIGQDPRAARKPAIRYQPPRPAVRRLRAYAFDPSLETNLDTAVLNETVLKVRWEDLEPDPTSLHPGPAAEHVGPIGDYLEVIDVDPASDLVYPPVDLNDPHLLAQDGLAPSESNPQFHQQMVYAVAMTTIQNFERELGRPVLWSPRLIKDRPDRDGRYQEVFVRQLRCYPHALREANAYYSPDKKALLFGYFAASRTDPGRNLPGGMVFTCLSHDIIAHELAHAILDGMHRRFVEPSNPDSLAFHEAFADIIALFQHFTFGDAVRHQIARTRGALGRQNLLSGLAKQFGEAIGRRGALREAIDTDPEPARYAATREPHERGAILVAALFDAFTAIYHARIADLLRLATGMSTPSSAELHPDLVNRLADEATKAARHLLRICIRALDYCPPVDITFGDYLRALITADVDHVPDDDRGYRIAIIEAFRRRGIYPHDCRCLAADALCWREPDATVDLPPMQELMARLNLDVSLDRAAVFDHARENQRVLWHWLREFDVQGSAFEAADGAERHEPEAGHTIFGIAVGAKAPHTIRRSRWDRDDPRPSFEVHSVRPSVRMASSGRPVTDLVVEITQARAGYLSERTQRDADADPDYHKRFGRPDFWFRGGCTLLVDIKTRKIRYCIVKDIMSRTRLNRQRRFLGGDEDQPARRALYFGAARAGQSAEPFALLHRG